MKKLLLLASILVTMSANFAFANVYDLSQTSNCKLVSDYSDDTIIKNIDSVIFGSYYQSNANQKDPIEWIVLEREGNKAFLLSKYILEYKCFESSGNSVKWPESSLRKWLNNDFYNIAFNSNEQNLIQMTETFGDKDWEYLSEGIRSNDRIFCLSFNEASRYLGDPNRNLVGPNKKNCYEWDSLCKICI